MATGPLTESAPDCEGDSAVADGRPEGFGEGFLMVLIPAGHMEGRLGRGPSETRTRGPEGLWLPSADIAPAAGERRSARADRAAEDARLLPGRL